MISFDSSVLITMWRVGLTQWYVSMIRRCAVNLQTSLTFFYHWLHGIWVCKAYENSLYNYAVDLSHVLGFTPNIHVHVGLHVQWQLLCVCPSNCQTVYFSVCLSVSSAICRSVCQSVCLSVDMSVRLSVRLSVCLFVISSILVGLSVWMYMYLCDCIRRIV